MNIRNPGPRGKSSIAAVAVAAVGVGVFVAVSPSSAPTAPVSAPAPLSGPVAVEGGAGPTATPSASASASAGARPSASASATAAATRSKAAQASVPAPKPSKNVAAAAGIALPPPPHDPGTVPTASPSPAAAGTASSSASAGASATATPSCPTYAGTDATLPQVQAALETAAATPRTFSYQDATGATQTVSITLPPELIEAEAWQESGWQSQIVSCDGGYGTMQIMSATATWMNSRFGTGYDYTTLAGNTQIGSEYLEWLIAWFGEVYYDDDFSLSNQNLLNDVIAAYNVGPGAVDPTAANGGIPNPQYVADVEALEQLQPWTAALGGS